jgi:hypothetical protein
VFSLRPPRGQVYVIKAMAPYAMQRINVNAPNETVRHITAINGGTWFQFEPLVNGSAAVLMESDLVARRTGLPAGTLTNNDRAQTKGISGIYENPDEAVDRQLSGYHDHYDIEVPGDRPFDIIFSLITPAVASAIANPYVVPTAAVPAPLTRVDIAGAVVAGRVYDDQTYRRLLGEAQDRPRYRSMP